MTVSVPCSKCGRFTDDGDLCQECLIAETSIETNDLPAIRCAFCKKKIWRNEPRLVPADDPDGEFAMHCAPRKCGNPKAVRVALDWESRGKLRRKVRKHLIIIPGGKNGRA